MTGVQTCALPICFPVTIGEANELGILDGVTTNPSLMAKEGIKGTEAVMNHYRAICEIVDGDKQTQGRTTGDVGFSLSAIANGKTVYVIYDSVLTLSSGNYATQGETRLAQRNTIYPEDWDYQTLDGPDSGVAVAGYDVVLAKSGTKVAAAWLSASGNRLPDPDQIKFLIIEEDDLPKSATTEEFGTPGWPIAIDNKGLIFGCEKRLCSIGNSGTTAKLVNGALLDGVKESATITINKARYAVTSINKKLVLIKL